MKRTFILSALLISLSYGFASAQCSDKVIKKLCKEGLGTYIFESAAFKPLTAFGAKKNMVEAAFSVYSQESYRVLNLCQGFGSDVDFNIYDTEKNLVFSSTSAEFKGKKHHDFVAAKSGDYTIEFKVPKGDVGNPNSCIAFAIGYK